MQNKITVDDRELFNCEHLVFRHDTLSAADLGAASTHLYEQFYRTKDYMKRVEGFLSKYPNYLESFTEYSEIMRQAGYATMELDAVHV
jgi:hypothetical protein